ncbi:MAG TPA: Ig-like domain-containing protein [Anaerolineales bacterium]|nr:Ig-like domain-containing protein [Anaerolineales bacterium]
MQKKPSAFVYRTSLFEPTRVFIALLIVAFLWVFPLLTLPEEQRDRTAYASESRSSCPNSCQIPVCKKWVPPGGSCQPENDWDIGCCTIWGTACDPACEEEEDPGGGNQPPGISHVLNCSKVGNNGWCIAALTLDLSASDPQGANVIISGDVNGNAFACPSGQTTCSIPLPEGSGTANYKVDSATGLSASGSTTYQLDVTTPEINGNINGSSGTNGWYITQAFVTASASDSRSGLASLEMNVDNTGYTPYEDTTFSDGIHTIQYRATDNAGNVTETALQEIKVDTTVPTLNVSMTGATGNHGWYISDVTMTPTASDPSTGSGLASVEMTADGGPWTVVTGAVTLTDGIHTVQFRATDHAGNVSQTAVQQIKVDATTPSLSLNISGTRGQNDWYTSATSVTPNASDTGSGINTIEAKINGGAWVSVTSTQSSVFSDGIHSYQYRVTDHAGNVTETPALPIMVDTVPPAIAMDNDPLSLGDTLHYDLEDTMSGLWINRTVIEDEDEKYKKIVWLEELTGNKSNDNEIRWDGVFADGTKAAPGQYFITLKISDQAGNETMRTVMVEVTAFNSLLPIPVFTPPASEKTSEVSETSDVSPAPITFGGTENGSAGNETTTTTSGETVFTGMKLQAGETSSFSSGNQTTTPATTTTSNILWGAAAAAMLGAKLADWQKKKEEEAAARKAYWVEKNAKKKAERARIDYLNTAYQAKLDREAAQREQTSRKVQQEAKIDEMIQMDMTEDEKLTEYKQSESYLARQERYAEYYAQKEQERLNAVSAARWAGVASVAQGKQEEEKKSGNWLSNLWDAGMSAVGSILSPKNAGGGGLLSVRDDDPPNPIKQWWDESVIPTWNKYVAEPIKRLLGLDQTESVPTSTPAVLPMQTKFPAIVLTPTISVSPTVTPTPTQSKIYNINGPMTLDQVPSEFICTLPEWKVINGQNLRNVYYDRCKIGEELMVELLTNPNGWWWQDGSTEYFDWNKNILVVTSWEGVKTNEDFWRLALAYGLDTEGTTLRRDNINGYGPLIEEAILNKFWHFDLGVRAQYGKPDASSGIYDPNDSSPLGTNGRLVALGSLQSLEMRNNVLQPPMDGSGSSTYMWDDSWNRYANLFENESESGWQPLPNAPYEVGNIDSDHFYYKIKNVEDGPGKFEVLYRSSPNAVSLRAIVLTFEQFAVYSQYPK